MKIHSIIPRDERPNCRCHFCGETRSVKYITEIMDPVIDNKPAKVYCCNKCIVTGGKQMTRSEMIAYIKANPYHKISHRYFSDDEYIYSGHDGNVYDEKGYLFECWDDPCHWYGIREREGGYWEDGWYVKTTVKSCQYFFDIPKVGVCCEAYYESKNSKGINHAWAHFPECSEENCPLKHPELLRGHTL